MKKLLFAVVVCTSMMSFSQEVAADAAAPKKDPAAEKSAKREKANKLLAAQAKQCGMTFEEFSKLPAAERSAKYKAAVNKRLAAQAAICGMTLEDFKALPVAERRAKYKAAFKARQEAKKAKKAAPAAE